jgi:putative hydrolase
MARLALECGCNFTLDADAHGPEQLAYVPMGAWMARRAGIPQNRILNFLDIDELTAALD